MDAAALELLTVVTPGEWRVHLAGELDASTRDALRAAIDIATERAREGRGAVTIDLTEVSLIDARGAHLLTAALAGNTPVQIAGAAGIVARVLSIVGQPATPDAS